MMRLLSKTRQVSKSTKLLEQLVSDQFKHGSRNVIGAALSIYDLGFNNRDIKTLIRNMTSEEINNAFYLALEKSGGKRLKTIKSNHI